MSPSTIEGIEQVNKALENVPKGLLKSIVKVININARLMQSHIRTEYLTGGTTDSRLRSRTGDLKESVIAIQTEVKDDRVEGGVSIGTKYARVHFGPRGQLTTITAKKGKYLTIPLPAALQGRSRGPGAGMEGPTLPAMGAAKGSAMFGPWTNTFIAKSKAGNLIIFGQLKSYSQVKVGGVAVKGVSIMKVKDKIVPLFLLKQSVTIPARIHPEDILAWISPKIAEDLRKKGLEVK